MIRLPVAGAAVALLSSCVGSGREVAAPAPAYEAPPPPGTPEPLRSWLLDGVPPQQGGLIHGTIGEETVSLLLDGRPVPVTESGSFIVGFDRDAAPTATLSEVRADGSVVAHPLQVRPGDWRIERVDAPYRAGKTDAAFARLRPAELAAIAAARATPTDADGWAFPLRWPATGRQSGWFGAGRVYQGQPGGYHSGADVAVPTGTPVTAPGGGVVILATDRPFTLEGNLLIIDHGMGLTSALLHLSRIDVRVGDRVRQGQPVALSGATGRVSGPHLHWGLQWRGAKLDPVKVVGAGPEG